MPNHIELKALCILARMVGIAWLSSEIAMPVSELSRCTELRVGVTLG